MKKNLDGYRKKIDIINIKILELLKERFLLVKKIGDIKRENSLSIEVKSREDEIYKYLNENNDFIPDASMKKIFKVIIDESKKFE